MKRVRPTAGAACVLVLLSALLGCSFGGSHESGSEAVSTEPTTPVSTPPEPGRDALIYAAVIRQLVTRDLSYDRFKVIFVLDGAVPRANRPTPPRDPKQSFAQDVKDDLQSLSARSDLPPLEFIAESDSVLMGAGSRDPGRVIRAGVLITLGRIEGGAKRVQVGNSAWVAGRGARWQTYMLRPKGRSWRITGATGPFVIS